MRVRASIAGFDWDSSIIDFADMIVCYVADLCVDRTAVLAFGGDSVVGAVSTRPKWCNPGVILPRNLHIPIACSNQKNHITIAPEFARRVCRNWA